MIDRRKFLGITAGAGVTLAVTPELLRALQRSGDTPELLRVLQQSGGKLIQRVVPSSGEMLPVIGLGRGNDTVDPAAFKEVLRALVENGGRVVDTVHDTVGVGEQLAATTANELGIQSKIFWSLRGTVPGDAAA